VFHKKKLYPLLFLLYLYYYTDEFHENPPEYTRGSGHCEDKINIRDSLTILCYCHYNEGTAKCQENKHKTRFILMQTSVNMNSENHHLLPIFTTNVQNVRRLQKHKHGDADTTA